MAAGVDVNAREDHRGETALYYAVWFEFHLTNSVEIIQVLTAAGANVYTTDLRDMYAPEYEYAGPVLFEAVNSVGGYLGTYSSEAVSLEVIQALLAAAVVAEAPEGYLQVEEVWTPLHLAIFTETQEAIRVMLDDRADPNAPDPAGNTPFHFAAAYSPPEVVRAMLDAGAGTPIFQTGRATLPSISQPPSPPRKWCGPCWTLAPS